MIINYTDIADEQESVSVSLTGLPTGVQSYVDWIQEETVTNPFTYYNENSVCSAVAGTNSRPLSDFDFSSAEMINLYDYARTGTQFELILSLDTHFEPGPAAYSTFQVQDIEPITAVRPGFTILCPKITNQYARDILAARYMHFIETVPPEHRGSPAYRLHAIKVATLDISPANAMERLDNIIL